MKMFRTDAADSRGISENWEENLPFKEGFALSLKGVTVNSHACVY